MTREQIIDAAMPATDRERSREWLRSIFCSALQGCGGMRSPPLEYDEPDPAPDFEDDENDDEENESIDVPAESIRVAGAIRKHAHQHAG